MRTHLIVATVTLALVAATTSGCASTQSGGFMGISAADNSKSDGSKSGDSKSGDSKSDGSKSDGSRSGESKSGDSKSDASHSQSGDGNETSFGYASTILAIVGSIMVTWLIIATVARKGPPEKATAYLQEHRRPIRVALARGSGAFIDDIATVLELPAAEVPTLAHAIHDARFRLAGWLVDAEVTPEDTAGFTTDLRQALDAEPRLAPYVQRTRERLEAALASAEPTPAGG